MFNTVKQIILKTKVVNEPYPHIIVKNLFPQKIYNDLIKILPDFNSLDDPTGKELLITSLIPLPLYFILKWIAKGFE